MTNAEKFYEVFGTKGWVDWDAEYKGEPTIPLSVIEKIHDAIDNADSDGYFEDEHGNYIGSVLTSQHVHEIIDKAVKEIKHEQTCICGNG